MMREFDLGAGRLCKVWIGEFPPISFSVERIDTRELKLVAESETASFKSATEIVIPRGGRMLYGALGVEFTPMQEKSSVTVEVNVSDALHNRFTDSLIAKVDDVFVGLPSEYVDAVFSGIELGQKHQPVLSPGILRIAYAAHGAASSNVPMFRQLALWLTSTKGEQNLVFNEDLLMEMLLI